MAVTWLVSSPYCSNAFFTNLLAARQRNAEDKMQTMKKVFAPRPF